MSILLFMITLLVMERSRADTLLQRLVARATAVQNDVRVAAIVPYLNDPDHCYVEALQEAADIINGNPVLLGGTKLVLKFAESNDSAALAMWNLNKLLNTTTDQRFLHIFGPVTWEPMNSIIGVADTFSITHVITDSVYNASIGIRDRYLYTAPQAMQAMFIAKTSLILHFNWRRIAFVYDQTDEVKAQIIVHTRRYLESLLNVTVLGSYGFQAESLSEDIRDGLRYLEARHAKIYIGLLSQSGAQKIFCEMFKLKMHRMRMTWILDDTLPSNWMEDVAEGVDCTREQLASAAEGHFWLYRSQLRDDDAPLSCNLTAKEVWERIERRHGSSCDTAATYSFDALWAFAEALKLSSASGDPINTKQITYFYHGVGSGSAGEEFAKVYPKLKLEGLSGYFEYSSEHERLGDMKIKHFSNGYATDVGAYFQRNGSIFIANASMQRMFPGGVVPHDDVIREDKVCFYNMALLVVSWLLACLGMFFCVICFFLESYTGNAYCATTSSPYLNYILILGSMLTYGSIWIYGIDPRLFSTVEIPRACNAFVLAIMVGFSLSYGSLLTTSWRYLQCLTHAAPPSATTLKCSLFIVVLCGLDVIVYAVWMGITPAGLTFEMLEEYMDLERDVVIRPSVARCYMRHYAPLVIAICAYKGILEVAGFFVAFEIRHIRCLNDSRYNGLAIYNVLAMSVVGLLAVSILYNAKSYQAEYLALMACVWIAVTMTLIITFGPKFWTLWRKLQGKASIDLSRRVSTVRIEANPATTYRVSMKSSFRLLAMFGGCFEPDSMPKSHKDHKPSVISLNTSSSEINYSRGRGDSNCSYMDHYQPKFQEIECGTATINPIVRGSSQVSSSSSTGPLTESSLSNQSGDYLSPPESGLGVSPGTGAVKCTASFTMDV